MSDKAEWQHLIKSYYYNWEDISEHAYLSEDFIREYKDKVVWHCISSYQTLSENFIKEFQDKVDWFWISRRQNLSENFIREFKDKVWLEYISIYQILSDKFRKEFELEYVLTREISKKRIIFRSNIFYYDRIKNIRVDQLPILPAMGVNYTF